MYSRSSDFKGLYEPGSTMLTTVDEDDGEVKKGWYTPIRLLGIFCVINLLNYMDRGVIASNGVNGFPKDSHCKDKKCQEGSGIQGEYGLSNFADGLLPAAFMVGLLCASPIFAAMSKLHNPFRLIGVGLSIWTVAVAGCGVSVGFLSLTFCRMLVGVGEASFVSLAAPFIDDNAPAAQKTVWLATFYMCIPVGIALGYVFGGVVGSLAGWRTAFFLEAILMLPFAVFGFLAEPLPLNGVGQVPAAAAAAAAAASAGGGGGGGSRMEAAAVPLPLRLCLGLSELKGLVAEVAQRIWEDTRLLLRNKVYVINQGGAITYTAVLGCYAYFGPKVGGELYKLRNADVLFGVITISMGVVGTMLGGVALDRMGATIANSFKFMMVSTLVGAVFCTIAFLSPTALTFCIFLAAGEFFLFAIQGPLNVISLQCVEPGMRSMSVAFSTILIHVLGDVPSPPLLGLFQDRVRNWRISTVLLTSILFITSACFYYGTRQPVHDHRVEVHPDPHPDGTPVDSEYAVSQTEPLLVGGEES